MKALRILRVWFLVSVPLGLIVGRFIKAGKGPPMRQENDRSDRP